MGSSDGHQRAEPLTAHGQILMSLDTDVLENLFSADAALVTDSARNLGLLLERARFRRRGQGNLGDTASLLGDLDDLELTNAQFRQVVSALIGHVESHRLRTNPTAVWALGKARDDSCLSSLESLAHEAMTDPERADLLYQIVSVVAIVAPKEHRELLLRAASEAVGEARALAQDLIDAHGWE